MKSYDVGVCSEIGVTEDGSLHVCALTERHEDEHECACGSYIDQEDIDAVPARDWAKKFIEANKR